MVLKLVLCFALERLPTEIEPLVNALCDRGASSSTARRR
jgi:hypothetical protein